MPSRNTLFAVLVFAFSCYHTQIFSQQCSVTNLQCEHMPNPLGIDAANPRLSWQLSDGRTGAIQKAYAIFVGTDSSEVANAKGAAWQSGKVANANQLITYNGKPFQPFTKYFWAVRVWDKDGIASPVNVATFETGMMHMSNWKGAWIQDSRDVHLKPAPYFRKAFAIHKQVASARAYIAVAGLYELYFNGEKISDHRLDPMYTRFDRRTLYVTHDVTKQLQQGDNVAGVLLGNGWYNHQSTAVWYFHEAPWRNRPSFCMDIRITYTDGSVETVTTGEDWKTTLSPVIFNSIYTGEHYDARLEIPHWNEPSYNDSAWKQVMFCAAPSQNIVAQVLYPIRNVEEIPVVSMNKMNDTLYVYKLAQNIAGVSKVTVAGDSGTVLYVKHGERLKQDGRVDQSNIDAHYRPTDNTDPFQEDIYILKGGTAESFMPHFNYKGFQYIEIKSSKPVVLTKESVSAYFMHSDVPAVGNMQTSNTTINKIWQAANNSYLSNLFGYPTDCPQREKNGWTGDGQIASETGLYNFDALTIYEKWLADHRDEQQPNGVLPSIIPTSGWGYEWGNGPDWTSTIAVIPWNIYLFYGDDKLLRDCYDNIKRYVDHINYMCPTGLTTWGLGDWIPVKSKAPVELTSSVYYFVDAAILAKAARLFNKQDDYSKYNALCNKIKDAINKKYLNRATGMYGSGLQTEQSVPLFWGVVPTELKNKVAANLAQRIALDSNKLDVGLLGTKAILNALSDNGYADVAYMLASRETFPSWGWWIKNGATTLYENWPIDAASDISMNHIMFGEIDAWFYKALVGIKPDSSRPGFKNILLQPYFVTDLDSVAASHKSPYGIIQSSWKRSKNGIEYKAVIPANSTATLTLNILKGQKLYQNNEVVFSKEGVYRQQLAAGTYNFQLQ